MTLQSEGMSHSFEHNKLITISLQTFTGFSALFSSLLKYCSSARTFSVLPASQNCDPIKSWASLSCCHSKYLVWFAFQEDLPSQNYIWIMGKDGEPTMERPSHPQQKFFKQHTHTPPIPRSCLKKHWENLVAEKENRKWGGGGRGKIFKRG